MQDELRCREGCNTGEEESLVSGHDTDRPHDVWMGWLGWPGLWCGRACFVLQSNVKSITKLLESSPSPFFSLLPP